MKYSWRYRARRIIEDVIKKVGNNEQDLKKALYDAYPFGQRKHYPYKIWLDEIKKQTQSIDQLPLF